MDLKKNIARMEQELAEMKAKMEQETTQYPIYCLHKETGAIVKFDGLVSGVVLKGDCYHQVGYTSNIWNPHNITEVWQQLPVCPKTGFYDGQPIWCWDNDETHRRKLRFFNAKNSCPFNYDGKRRDDIYFCNFAPFEGKWFDWMEEAFNTLEK